MSADEVSVWLGELLQLSGTKKRSEAESKRVEELCQLLRRAGFTNKWLEDYTERARPVRMI